MRKWRLYTGVQRGHMHRLIKLYQIADKSRVPLEYAEKLFPDSTFQAFRDELIARANLLLSVYVFADGHTEPPLPDPPESLKNAIQAISQGNPPQETGGDQRVDGPDHHSAREAVQTQVPLADVS